MSESRNAGAVVVLSGGQDSTTVLFWALRRFGEVVAVSFDYGQRHSIELKSARIVAAMANVPHVVIDAKYINALAPNALTRANISITHEEGKLPSTFVDGRNLFFLSMAAVYAKQLGFNRLVAGMCEMDFSGYPDCRRVFIDSLEKTLTLAMDYPIEIWTPLMEMTKAAEVKMAVALGPQCLDALAYSHTCYQGVFPPCGTCPACELRHKGFEEAGYPDPLVERYKRWYFSADETK